MVKITKNGKIIALCDEPRYIKVNPKSGAFIQAKDYDDAEGIAVNGTPYSIFGKPKLKDLDEVLVNNIDSGIYLFNDQTKIEEHSDSIATIEDYLCEQDTAE